MPDFPTPPVTDLARIAGVTKDEMVQWLIAYYNRPDIPWNYICGRKCIIEAYKGLHALPLLVAGCAREKNNVGRDSNEQIVTLAAPLAFGRKTQVHQLPRKQFAFGQDLRAGYNVPFFFVEDGVVRLYYVQPRKTAGPSVDQLSMVATIHKRYLLDREFFGLPTDVEYVNLSEGPITHRRDVRVYSLSSLTLWSDQRLKERLTLITAALNEAWNSGLIIPRKRAGRRPDPDMPLFD